MKVLSRSKAQAHFWLQFTPLARYFWISSLSSSIFHISIPLLLLHHLLVILLIQIVLSVPFCSNFLFLSYFCFYFSSPTGPLVHCQSDCSTFCSFSIWFVPLVLIYTLHQYSVSGSTILLPTYNWLNFCSNFLFLSYFCSNFRSSTGPLLDCQFDCSTCVPFPSDLSRVNSSLVFIYLVCTLY